MLRHDDPAAARRLRPRRAAATPVAAAVAATVALAAPFPAALAATPGAVDTGFGWPLLGAAAVLAAAAAAAGYALARWRTARAVHEARLQAQGLAQLFDVWQWQTDAEHRLVRLQPPPGAPAADWAQPVGDLSAAPLWDRFETVDGSSLRARLQAHAALPEIDVHRLGAGGLAPWRLRGVPRHDADGRFAGHLGTARPLQAERLLQADAAALDAALDALSGAAWIGERLATGDWRLRRCNAAAAQRLGGVTDALAWPQVLAALPAELRAPAAGLDGSGTLQAGGWTLVQRDRGEARVLLLGSAETAVEAEDARAERESFSYTVSHDLRAPLRVVEGFTRILKEDYGRALDRVGNDHLDRVLGAAARMNNMIDALLALSQLSSQPLARQPVSLSQLAAFVVDDLRREAPARQVDVQIAPGLEVEGDPTLLRVALENLLGNAWKYCARTPGARIGLDALQQGSRRVFVVSDNGAGFDMRFADRLFGVFQRLHSANDFPGTGIGLATVRRIVRRHGGDIWAEAEVGRGAKFYFTLGG